MNQFLRGTQHNLSSIDILWGLTDQSPQEEICEKAFQLISECQYISVSMVSNGHPESRVIDLQRLKDGRMIFITSKYKPFYQQLCKCPEIVACLPIDTWFMIRVRAFVKEVSEDQAIRDEYFEANPGTKLMYRNNLSAVAFFVLEKGEGEMFHLYNSERVRRVRFGFGGLTPWPLTYSISYQCVGCGICQENCAEQAIFKGSDGKYHISHMDCDDCGICYTKCPNAGTALLSRLEAYEEDKRNCDPVRFQPAVPTGRVSGHHYAQNCPGGGGEPGPGHLFF
ncbi:4Fe-4S dicluster domain-containing protein [Flintibacter muris]|uniref:4Fe-4S dicluster domain-containing protein n=1 Tax=Flintibacter muris TaxID=2941327 RepID=UPI0020403364|nr:4Fe-4S dicluster domain-containing protein [Flintibacter muris]